MKLILKLVVILFACYAPAAAQDIEKEISVSYTDIRLESVLTELAQQYNLKFSYSKDLVQLDKKITVSVEKRSIRKVLETIFEQAAIQYQFIGDQIALIGKSEADRPILLRGKVIDKATHVPLAFASIRIDGTVLGNATNSQGEFVLNIPVQHRDSRVTVSFVGYESYHLPVSNSEKKIVIELEEDTKELNAVVVTDKTGLSILEEAIARIHQNYDTAALVYTYFIKDLTFQNNEPIGASETIYQAYRAPASAPPIKQVKIIKGRRLKDFTSLQKILGTFPRWTGFEVGIDINTIYSADLGAPRKEDEFLSSKFLKQHQFELLGLSLLKDKEVYIIEFDQKDAYKNRSLYKGKFYIDTETLAFTRIEAELSPKGLKNARFFGTPKALALLFGFSKCAILNTKTITNYNAWNGKWYVNSMEVYFAANLAKSKPEFFSALTVEGELIVTDIQTDRVKPFGSAEAIRSDDLKDWRYMYDTNFWDGRNMIPTDPDMEASFHAIAKKNKENGINMNFWRRYQPYKSNPSLLVVDSALCQQSPVVWTDSVAMSSPLSRDPGNKLLLPKYPPLSRTFNTKHFTMHFIPTDSSGAQDVSIVLEYNYERVMKDFQLNDLSERINVELYPDIENYHFAIGDPDAPDSDVGMAVDNNTVKIVSPTNPGAYHTYETILKGAVHEFAHCVHYNFMDQLSEDEQLEISKNDEAPWLFEAMASYEARQFYDPDAFDYLKKGQYPSIKELNEVEQNGKIYDVGFTIIEFMHETWGKESVINLLKKNGNIKSVFGIDETEFESKFYAYLRKVYLKSEN